MFGRPSGPTRVHFTERALDVVCRKEGRLAGVWTRRRRLLYVGVSYGHDGPDGTRVGRLQSAVERRTINRSWVQSTELPSNTCTHIPTHQLFFFYSSRTIHTNSTTETRSQTRTIHFLRRRRRASSSPRAVINNCSNCRFDSFAAVHGRCNNIGNLGQSDGRRQGSVLPANGDSRLRLRAQPRLAASAPSLSARAHAASAETIHSCYQPTLLYHTIHRFSSTLPTTSNRQKNICIHNYCPIFFLFLQKFPIAFPFYF